MEKQLSFGEKALNIEYIKGNNDKEQNVLEKYAHLLDYLDAQAKLNPADMDMFDLLINQTKTTALLTAAIFDKLAE